MLLLFKAMAQEISKYTDFHELAVERTLEEVESFNGHLVHTARRLAKDGGADCVQTKHVVKARRILTSSLIAKSKRQQLASVVFGCSLMYFLSNLDGPNWQLVVAVVIMLASFAYSGMAEAFTFSEKGDEPMT